MSAQQEPREGMTFREAIAATGSGLKIRRPKMPKHETGRRNLAALTVDDLNASDWISER